ncbi:MAG TPA: hypothetical protein VNV66_14170 [Pilimelia sp.]|nr:hypothetical protein [Pilimelia sp.]
MSGRNAAGRRDAASGRRRIRRAAAAGLLAVVAVLLGAGLLPGPAAPAWAHGGDAPDGTNYRTAVTAVRPALPGVTVRAVEAGARLELHNRSGQTVEILGYQGEPYLEVRPDGVYENVRSPATYLNATLSGGVPLPADASPAAAPQWRRISDQPVTRWHDHRAHWMSDAPPPQVRAAPGREHRIRDWQVPLRVGLDPAHVHGTLDWVPPPAVGAWWAYTLVGAVVVALLGFASPGRVGRAATAGAAGVAGLATLAYAVARELDAGATTAGAVAVGLLGTQLWAVLTGLGALAAVGYAALGRPAADFALALTGASVALFAGVANAAVFGRGVAPVPGSATLARVAVATVIAAGVGAAVSAGLRMRAAAAAEAAATDAPPAG